jgi:IS5 family transposase
MAGKHTKRMNRMIVKGEYDDELRHNLKELYEDWGLRQRSDEERAVRVPLRKRSRNQSLSRDGAVVPALALAIGLDQYHDVDETPKPVR